MRFPIDPRFGWAARAALAVCLVLVATAVRADSWRAVVGGRPDGCPCGDVLCKRPGSIDWAPPGPSGGVGAASNGGTQVVYLDFDTFGGNTMAERQAIRDRVAEFYAPFDYEFTLDQPTSGDYAQIVFNFTDPSAPDFAGGLAQHVDHRNLLRNDFAIVNVNPLLGGTDLPADTEANRIALNSFVAAHELGHLSGLRHYDSFGPIGSGVPFPVNFFYFPGYPGPSPSFSDMETGMNTMATPAIGQSLEQAIGPASFSERSAIKLAFNGQGLVVDETADVHDTFATAQALLLGDLAVPNTRLPGQQNFGSVFDVEAINVLGSIGVGDEVDYYSFTATAGDILNVEVIASLLPGGRASPLDPVLGIFDAFGNLLNYFGDVAVNDDEFESFDSSIVDLILPTTGLYYIGVTSSFFSTPGQTDTGSYELFFSTFSVVPEPSTVTLLLMGAALAAGSSRLARVRRGGRPDDSC